MDFLNSSLSQLKDLFLSMTPAARITSGVLVAVVVISLGYLATHEISGPEVYLLSGETFSIGELNGMEEAFGKEGLSSYELVAGKVRVPLSQRSDYMDALARHEAMPKAFGDIITKALEAGSVLTSPSDRAAYLKNGREVQLAQAVSMIDEVEAATVMYDTETKPTGLGREKVYSATVIVEPVGPRPLDPELASSIRLLVSGAIAGLEAKDVAVTDRNTGHTTFGNSQDSASPHDDRYFAVKLLYEQKYTDDILRALHQIRGLTVTTHVELETEHIQTEEITRDALPAGPASEKRSTSPATASEPLAGLLGFKSQGNAPRSLASMASASVRQRIEESEGQISTVVKKTEKGGFTPKRVSVAVTVPTSYFESVWRQNAIREGTTPDRPQDSDLAPIRTKTFAEIKRVVGAIIDRPDGATDSTELVTVAEFPDVIPPEIPVPGLGHHVLTWLAGNWRTLGLIALGLLSLFMLRSMIRGASNSEVRSRVSASVLTEQGEGEAAACERESRKHSLSEVVTDDPDAAAGILRNWIGNAT